MSGEKPGNRAEMCVCLGTKHIHIHDCTCTSTSNFYHIQLIIYVHVLIIHTCRVAYIYIISYDSCYIDAFQSQTLNSSSYVFNSYPGILV